MFRAMVVKELRETRAIFLAALLAFGYLFVSRLYPWLLFSRAPLQIPFVQDNFLAFFVFIAGAMAIGVGVRQTLGESVSGTYAFFFHRPAGRRWLIGMKLIVGLSGCLICSSLPIAAYSLWAATPGTHASPFEWSMTAPVWVVWFAMPLLYFGAFLTGIRPAGWWRSRLLPLAAAVLIAIVGCAIVLERGRPLSGLLIIIVGTAVALTTIFSAAATRDYT